MRSAYHEDICSTPGATCREFALKKYERCPRNHAAVMSELSLCAGSRRSVVRCVLVYAPAAFNNREEADSRAR